jgi:hypothetical protein
VGRPHFVVRSKSRGLLDPAIVQHPLQKILSLCLPFGQFMMSLWVKIERNKKKRKNWRKFILKKVLLAAESKGFSVRNG